MWNRRTGDSDNEVLEDILGRLDTLPNSVWFDPAWDDGVATVDDSGTLRYALILSRPIHTQYDLASLSTPQGPAVVGSPNGRNIMSFGGSHWMGGLGTAALAAMFQGLAQYSEISLVSREMNASMTRMCIENSSGVPNNRLNHAVSVAGNVDQRGRTAAGAGAIVSGAAVSISTMHALSSVYTGTAYSTWIDGALSINNAAIGFAPTPLDTVLLGARLSPPAVTSLWNGLQACLVLVPGAVISADDRQALESDLLAYYGYA